MPRRKNAFLSDGSSDSNASGSDENGGYNSQEDPDARAERELFELGGRKRRKMGHSKESAWEGIFGDEDDDDRLRRGGSGRGGRGGGAARGRGGAPPSLSKFKAPTFVAPSSAGPSNSKEPSPSPPPPAPAKQPAADDSDMDIDESGSESDGSSYDTPAPRSPRVREPDSSDDDKPPAGLGLGASRGRGGGIGSRSTRGGIGSGGGIGSRPNLAAADSSQTLGGIGSSSRHQVDEQVEETLHPEVPSSFGSNRPQSVPPRQQRSFLPRASAALPAPAPSSSLPASELKHLQSISSTFGARMLAKQGYVPGRGLGKELEGLAVPIEANTNLVGRKGGISKGVRTEQSKRQGKDKGEVFSSDEERERRKDRKKGKAGKVVGEENKQTPVKGEGAGWKRDRKVRTKVEHKTYEELLAEAGEGAASFGGVGKILDARSGELKEVDSLHSISLHSWTPTADTARLPELRHNLRLLLEHTSGEVAAMVKEGRAVKEKKEWGSREAVKLDKLRIVEEERIARMKDIQVIIKSIQTKLPEIGQHDTDPFASLSRDFLKLLKEYKFEYEEYDLDEVVVGAIAQLLNTAFREWEPLEDDGKLVNAVGQWKTAYRLGDGHGDEDIVALYEVNGLTGNHKTRAMTAYEAMLNTLWLPRVRSTINNDWNPQNPSPAVSLVETWSPLIPGFMRDNIFDQLILPKVHKEVKDWNPRSLKARNLASMVFPWLSLLGDRADELLDEARIRIGEVMKKWSVKDSIPEELGLWREVFSRGKWDTLVLINVLPKLATYLDVDFEVNPRSQDMSPLERVLGWSGLMRESTFAQLLEEKFFPKWVDTLHFWLVQPGYSAGEVATWYDYWKDFFADYTSSNGRKLTEVEGIAHGFSFGIKLMEQALILGLEAPQRLARPTFLPLPDKLAKEREAKTARKKQSRVTAAAAATETEITFKSIAEKYAADHNLIFLPTGRSHVASGKPLFKVCGNVDGRGGVTVYVGEDAVYAMVEDGKFRAVLLDDMVKMAGGK